MTNSDNAVKLILLTLIILTIGQLNAAGLLNNIEKVSEAQKQVDMLHYYFKINLLPDQKEIECESIITAVLLNRNLSEIELNLYDNLKIDGIELNNAQTEFRRNKNKIFVQSNELNSDTITLKINYSGKPKRAGFDGFVFGEVNGTALIYNISEPTYAPTWFVCDDDPSDKVILDIEITNDSQFVSVSNGVLQTVKSLNDKKTYHYKTLYPIATYLIAVYSAPYKTFQDTYISMDGKDTMSVQYFVLPEHFNQAKIDFADHVDMLQVFSNMFGEYPFIKEKYGVAEFLWNFGAMENQTITGIGYNFLSGRDFFKDTYVHELAHHWWGNSVSPKTWDDIWLNEGFATYCEALYAEAKFGKSALKSKMMSKFSENFKGTLYAPKNLFSETVYEKGGWVLHMLRYELGDSAFFDSMRKYYSNYKYSNASVEDFKNVCEIVSGKNLDKFFDQWIYTGDEIPFIDYNISIGESNGKKFCELKMLQTQKRYPEFNLPIDVQIIYEDGRNEIHRLQLDSRLYVTRFELDGELADIIIDPDENLLAVFNKVNFD